MICAYDELYLPLAQRVMGDMLDYAVNTLEYELSRFFHMFIGSGMAHQFETGNPTYVAGKNGCEVAKEVIARCGLEQPKQEDAMYVDKSEEYWIGWTLAYCQWENNLGFAEIERCISIEELYRMYPTYHEMDVTRLSETLRNRIKRDRNGSALRRYRAYAGVSQRQLAQLAGVPLRQIQLFEQGQRDIRKTQGDTLLKLSRALQCEMEQLL